MTRRRRGSLALRRRALPSPPPCRFIPALSPIPRIARWPDPCSYGGELVQPGGHARGEQRAVHPGHIHPGVSRGEMPEGGAELAVAEDVLDRGAVPEPVLRRHGLIWRGHVQVRQYERVAVDRTGAGDLGERQGTLIGAPGPAPPRP